MTGNRARGRRTYLWMVAVAFCLIPVILVVGITVVTYKMTTMSEGIDRIGQTCNRNVTSLSESVKSMQEDLQKQKEAVAALKDRMNGLTTQIAGLNAKVDELGQTIQKNFDEVLHRLPQQQQPAKPPGDQAN